MNKEELKKLETDLWRAADNLRANTDLKSSEYATPVLGLIFLKFADNKYRQHEQAILVEYTKLKGTRRDKPMSEIAIEKCGFYLPDHARYDYLLKLPEEKNIAKAIKQAMIAIEEFRVDITDEVGLQFYRLERVFSGAIELREGDITGVKSPTEVGTGRAKDEKAPLSEIIEVLNERFGTEFTDEDRLFFEQIKEKATKHPKVIDTALANPLDKFELGVRKLIEELMIQRMGENDKIVTRYMDDRDFQATAFSILAREIFNSIRGNEE